MRIVSKSLSFRGWRLAPRTFSSLYRFSMGLRSGDWLCHFRTLMCFFLSHSFVLGHCHTHPRLIFDALAGFNALALTVHGPIHHPFDAVQLSCPLSRKTPPKHNVFTSVFDGGDGVLGAAAFLLLQTRRVELMPKSWILFSSDHNTFTQFSSESLANFRRACTCAFWSWGTLRVLQGFSPSRRCVLPNVFLVNMVPAALRSLTCSSGLNLHRSHDHWNSTRWDLSWSPSPREIYNYFEFIPFANNCTDCCHLLTKLHGDGLVAHSSLV